MARAHCMAVARDPTTGATLTSATVNVYNPGTVTPIGATMFDKNGNTLTNPLTSDVTTGLIDFYLNVAQEVDLVVAKASYTTRTYSNVPVIDDASFDLTAVLTTTGDLVYASGSNTPARLPIGVLGSVMITSGGLPTWSTAVTVFNSPNLCLDTLSATMSGNAIQAAILGRATGNSSGTTEISGLYSAPATAATAFTCTSLIGFHAAANSKGATSTVSNNYGILVDSQTAGNTNNYGVYINAPSGGAGVNIGLTNLGRTGLGVAGGSNASAIIQGFTSNSSEDALLVKNLAGTSILEVRNDSAIGFFAGGPAAKQTVTGSRGANVALASLLTALATYGLITDSSS